MRKGRKEVILRWASAAATVSAVLLTASFSVLATENDCGGSNAVPAEDRAVASVSGGDVINILLPVIPEGEESPFDFLLDPQGLLYETDAMRYGGGRVERGATLLFRNHAGEYDFSRYSDKLTVKNQSDVPGTVTVSACVSNYAEGEIVERNDFSESESHSIYLAIVDDRGNEKPLSAEREVTLDLRMDAASEEGEAMYSFGLTGACNPNVDWQGIAANPKVTVTWRIASAAAGKDTATEEENMRNEDAAAQEESVRSEDADGMETVSGSDAGNRE